MRSFSADLLSVLESGSLICRAEQYGKRRLESKDAAIVSGIKAPGLGQGSGPDGL